MPSVVVISLYVITETVIVYLYQMQLSLTPEGKSLPREFSPSGILLQEEAQSVSWLQNRHPIGIWSLQIPVKVNKQDELWGICMHRGASLLVSRMEDSAVYRWQVTLCMTFAPIHGQQAGFTLRFIVFWNRAHAATVYPGHPLSCLWASWASVSRWSRQMLHILYCNLGWRSKHLGKATLVKCKRGHKIQCLSKFGFQVKGSLWPLYTWFILLLCIRRKEGQTWGECKVASVLTCG